MPKPIGGPTARINALASPEGRAYAEEYPEGLSPFVRDALDLLVRERDQARAVLGTNAASEAAIIAFMQRELPGFDPLADPLAATLEHAWPRGRDLADRWGLSHADWAAIGTTAATEPGAFAVYALTRFHNLP